MLCVRQSAEKAALVGRASGNSRKFSHRKASLTTAALLAGGGVAFLASPAQANPIGVNFTGLNGGNSVSIAADASPGVVFATNYNNIDGPSGSYSITDSTGTKNATLTINSAAGAYPQDAPNIGGSTTDLYTGSLYGDNTRAEVSVTLSNIPFSSYDLYVYGGSDGSNNGNRGSSVPSVTDGTTTFYYVGTGDPSSASTALTMTTSTDSDNPTIGLSQYQVFHETSASVTISQGGSVSGAYSNNLFGLEVVDTTQAPEPASLGILGVGAIGLLARRRRTSKNGF